MSSPRQSGDGIIRTASGRETYAPDGHVSDSVEDHAVEKETFHDDDTTPVEETVPLEKVATSRSSSEYSAGYAPLKTGTHHQDTEGSSSSDYISTTLTRRKTQATIEDEDRRELQQIYSTLSRRASTIAAPGDPAVDPQSESFQLPKFLKMFRHQLEEEGVHMKKVGLLYKKLNVYGSGAALQLQQTVADFIMAPLRLGESFSFGEKERKHILRNFDGVVRNGELLIVLGRPGSGCSTLLKTMCGELHGLEMDKSSVIHYNGIPQKQMTKEFKGEAIYNQEVRGICRIGIESTDKGTGG